MKQLLLTTLFVALFLGIFLPVSNAQTSNGLLGSYYNNMMFAGSPTYTQVDPQVYFDWGLGSPSGLNKDDFSIRWSGYITPPTTGDYTLYVNADDGMKIYINGYVVLDKWLYQPLAEQASCSLSLTGGTQYPIVVEYFEGPNIAQSQLLWSGPSVAKQVIPAAVLTPGARESLTAVPGFAGCSGMRAVQAAEPTVNPTMAPVATMAPTQMPVPSVIDQPRRLTQLPSTGTAILKFLGLMSTGAIGLFVKKQASK